MARTGRAKHATAVASKVFFNTGFFSSSMVERPGVSMPVDE
jgi:hypothetical protein